MLVKIAAARGGEGPRSGALQSAKCADLKETLIRKRQHVPRVGSSYPWRGLHWEGPNRTAGLKDGSGTTRL